MGSYATLKVLIAKKQVFFEPMDSTKKNLYRLVQNCITLVCVYVYCCLGWMKAMQLEWYSDLSIHMGKPIKKLLEYCLSDLLIPGYTVYYSLSAIEDLPWPSWCGSVY